MEKKKRVAPDIKLSRISGRIIENKLNLIFSLTYFNNFILNLG